MALAFSYTTLSDATVAIALWLARGTSLTSTFAVGTKTTPWIAASAVGVGIGTVGLSYCFSAVLHAVLGVGASSTHALVASGLEGPGAQVLAVGLVVGLLAPLCEELVFRGLLWRLAERTTRTRHRGKIAWLLTSVVFAALHLEPVHALLVLPGAAALGAVRYYTGSVVPCILTHMATNLVALALIWRGAEGSPWVVASLALFVPSVWVLVRHRKSVTAPPTAPTAASPASNAGVRL